MKFSVLSCVAAVLAATAIVSAPAQATSAQAQQSTAAAAPYVEPGLLSRVTAAGKLRVNVLTKARTDLPAAATNGEVVQMLSRFPVVTLRVDAAAVTRLSQLPSVLSVTEDRPVPPVLAESVPLIGADKTRAAGMTGAGSVVAVLDTGVAVNHPFLKDRVLSEACFSTIDPDYSATSLCPNGESEQEGPGSADTDQGPCADVALDCDHGTHVAGIAIGNGTGVTGAPPAGVAPGAELVAIQVFSKFTSEYWCGAGSSPCLLSFTSDQLFGLEKVLALQESGVPLVAANMSLGGGQYTAACDEDPLEPVIEDLRTAGIATVVAAGNNGFGAAVSSPACVSSAVTVGASTDEDGVATFSNRGAMLDVFAPGAGIISSVPGGKWATMSGTSMAAPHVTGALAVLRQAKPTATLAELEAAIKSAGKPITYSGVTTPRLQLAAAVNGGEEPPEDGEAWSIPFFENVKDTPIPDHGNVTSSIPISGMLGSAPATLEIYVDIHHTWRGELKIDLIAPDNKVYPLRAPEATDSADVLHETYTVNASASPANGTWKLRVEDVEWVDTGFLDAWSISMPCFGNWDDVDIPDPGVAESSIILAWLDGNAPSRTRVHVEIGHTWRGDLKIDLIAPGGKVYPLRAADAKDGTDNINESYWVSATVSPASGTWKLRVEDLAKGDKGYIDGWTLTL
ncbi:Proprotein convertase P-domain-containing protein [Nonomuraea solani]|uniref:Proprotein convertase P-domain-containing protein n=1 Tax=Nonomuraea solani TaxID=1144553 RepID=A0A1H6EXY0_9ACTN|nr:S8 family serine peptidase [Nonomuraea solani]SEH02263.1 Proprotein convertase P-domain-containing protein [Nonomuraea solani]